MKIFYVRICVLLLLLSCSISYSQPLLSESELQDKEAQIYKFALYVGLNDKRSYSQIISSKEAEEKVKKICLEYASGYTLINSKGAYHDGKRLTEENGFILVFYVPFKKGKIMAEKIAKKLVLTLNQSSILIECHPADCRFYTYEEALRPD